MPTGAACASTISAAGWRGRSSGVRSPARKSLPSSAEVVILARSAPGEIRALALDRLGAVDCAIERPGGPLDVGDEVVGRVARRVPAMAGAFVHLPGNAADGFLPDTAGAQGLTEGTHLLLRVTRGPQGGKGPRLAAVPGMAEGPVRLLARGPGAVERLANLHPQAAIRVDRPAVAATLPLALRPRLSMGLGDLAERVASIWSGLEDLQVALPAGARMTITPTPALVAIDIDAGAATAERRPKKEAQLALNRGLLASIARAIRLRHLAGAILIDPAGMAQRDRQQLAAPLAEALSADPLRPQFRGFTALGFAEILRPRLHSPLHELLGSPHTEALAALAALCSAWESRPGSAEAIVATPEILGAIEADTVAREQFRDRTGRYPSLYAEHPTERPYRGWRLADV